jgi:hypothetical protein
MARLAILLVLCLVAAPLAFADAEEDSHVVTLTADTYDDAVSLRFGGAFRSGDASG